MFSLTPPSVVNGDRPWLTLIHIANGIDPEMFGEPRIIASGREVYVHAMVTHNDDATVTVEALTDHGSEVLTDAKVGL